MIKDNFIYAGILIFFLTCMFLIVILASCTISFSNISTHGTATDLVDEEQGASADLKADIPINPLRP